MIFRPCLLMLLFLPPIVYGMEDFRPLLDEAVLRGDKAVTIPAGTYRLKPREGETSHVVMKGAKDLVINAEGVRLVCKDLTRAVTFANCQNVTLKGLSVDYDPLPYTQGKVVAVAPDFGSIDIKLDTGYPRKPYSRIDVVDPATRFRKRGMPFLWGTRAEMVDDDTVRVHLKEIGKAALVGDLASLSTGPRQGGAPHGIAIAECEGMVFEDVSVLSAPGFGIIEQDGEGGMRFTRCKVVPGPKPPGATEERLLSSTWDAMQSKTMRRGPIVEYCEIRDAGDDSWSVQSSDYLVVAVDGSKAILAFRDEYCVGPLAGDRLTASLDANPVVIKERRAIKLPVEIGERVRKATPWTLWKTSSKAVEVLVDGTFPYKVGDSVYCPDRQGAGFVFRNNVTHSSGRILIKAGDGLIENNRVTAGHAGITVAPEVPDEAASGIRNLVIRGNSFAGTGYFCPSYSTTQAGCISVASSAKRKIFENITIENNRFEDFNGPGIALFDTKDVAIKGNIFCRVMKEKPSITGEGQGVDREALLWLRNSSEVIAERNMVFEPGVFLKRVAAGKEVDISSIEQLTKGFTVSDQACPGTITTPH